MLDHELQRKLEKVHIMESQLYRQGPLWPKDYKTMIFFAETLHQTTGEILEHIKREAKKKI